MPASTVFPHCQHVFFAGCHDSGYVSFLSPIKHDQKDASKLTLIETYNTNANYYQMGFKMTSFPDVFRREDFPQVESLPTRVINTVSPPPPAPSHRPRPSSISEALQPAAPPSATPIGQTAPANGSHAAAPVSSPVSAPGTSWATVGKGGIAKGQTISIASSRKAAPKKRFYLLNMNSERVDGPLPQYNAAAERRFNERIQDQGGLNFCNQCAIFGPDSCYQRDMRHKHGDPCLSEDEFNVLLNKARNLVCKMKLECADPICPYSHHCRKGGKECLDGSACKRADTHHVDIVRKTLSVVV